MGIEVERLEFAVAATGFSDFERDMNKIPRIVEKTAKDASQKFRIDYNSEDFKRKTETFKKGFDDIKEKSAQAGNAINNTATTVSKSDLTFANFAGDLAGDIFKDFIGGAYSGAKALLEYNMALESSHQKFSQILGDSDLAARHLRELRQYSLNAGQDFGWVVNSAKDFERLKYSVGDVLPLIEAISRVTAGTGGNENEKQQITETLREVIKTRHATLETINSLESAGVSQSHIWEFLRRETGKSNEELVLLAKNGKISSETFIAAFEKLSKVKFSDSIKKEQATLQKSWEAIKQITFNSASEASKEWTDNVSKLTQRLAEWYKSPATQAFLTYAFKSTFSPSLRGKLQAADEARNQQTPNEGPRRIDYSNPQSLENAKKRLNPDFNSDEFLRNLEISKQNLENYYKDRFDIIANSQKIEQTKLDSQLRLTSQDEIKYLEQQKANKDYYLRLEISRQTEFFNRRIELAKREPQEVAELTQQKNEKIRSLNADLQTNEISTQKAIAEVERRILESRRQAQIQFKQLQLREVSQVADSVSFDVNRKISFGGNLAEMESNFTKLRNLTASEYELTTNLVTGQYEIQLQNERLTWEEKLNLNKQKFLDLQNLTERKRQSLQAIDDRANDFSLQKQERFLTHRLELESQFFDISEAKFQNLSILAQNFAFSDIDSEITKVKKNLESLKLGGIDGNSLQVQGLNELGKLLESTKTKPFEKVELDKLDSQSSLQAKMFEEKRDALNKQLAEYKKYGRDTNEIEHQITVLTNEEQQTRTQNAINHNQKYFQTIDGLRERLKAMQSGKADIELKNQAEKDLAMEQANGYQEIATLKERIARFDELGELEIKKAGLQDVLDLRYKELDATISINRSQLLISQQWNVSNNQIQASVMELLASQKSLTEIFSEAETGAIQDAFNLVDSSVHSLASSLGLADTAAGRFFETMINGLAKLALNKLFQVIFGGQTADVSGGGASSGGGGFWSSLFKGLLKSVIGSVTGGLSGGGFGVYSGPDVGYFAEGGWVDPVPGGVFANIAEGGYPEAVLSTNPIYRERSAKIARKFLSQTVAPTYNFGKNYASNNGENRLENGGRNEMTHFENHFHFHADRQTGNFSKASAQQEIKRMMDAQKNEARRR